MNVCGIVVEYNPFHNGHIHHIHQARKALMQREVEAPIYEDHAH